MYPPNHFFKRFSYSCPGQLCACRHESGPRRPQNGSPAHSKKPKEMTICSKQLSRGMFGTTTGFTHVALAASPWPCAALAGSLAEYGSGLCAPKKNRLRRGGGRTKLCKTDARSRLDQSLCTPPGVHSYRFNCKDYVVGRNVFTSDYAG